jgi:hypothetical protein
MSSEQKKSPQIIAQEDKIDRLKKQLENRTGHGTKSQQLSEIGLAEKRLVYLKKPRSRSPSPQRPSRKAPSIPRPNHPAPNLNKSSTNTPTPKKKRPSHNTSRTNRRNASQRHQEIARKDPTQQREKAYQKKQEMTQCNKKIQDFKRKYNISKQSRTSLKEFNKQQQQREKEKEELLSYLNQQENCKRFIDELNSEYENKILDTLRHGLWAFIKQLPTSAKNFQQLEKDFERFQPAGNKSLHKFLKKYNKPESLKRIKKIFTEFEKESQYLIELYNGKIKNQQHITDFNSQKEHTLKLIPFLKTTLQNVEDRLKDMEKAKEFAKDFIKSLNIALKNPKSLTSKYLHAHKEMTVIKKKNEKKVIIKKYQ